MYIYISYNIKYIIYNICIYDKHIYIYINIYIYQYIYINHVEATYKRPDVFAHPLAACRVLMHVRNTMHLQPSIGWLVVKKNHLEKYESQWEGLSHI